MDITVTFPGGKKVDAEINGRTVYTDQSVKEGGEASAPSPYEYMLAALATCAGFYVLSYLQARDLPFADVKIKQIHEFEKKAHKLQKVSLIIELPKSIDEKHYQPIERSAQKCSVKKLMENPPEFDIGAIEAAIS